MTVFADPLRGSLGQRTLDQAHVDPFALRDLPCGGRARGVVRDFFHNKRLTAASENPSRKHDPFLS